MYRVIPHPPRWVVAALVGAAVALSTGCAKTGKVSGKVTLEDGSPLPGGVISFVPEDSGLNPAAANLKEDGTYEVEVPVGNCKVSIDNRSAGKTETLIGVGGGYNAPVATMGPPGMQGKGMKGGKGKEDKGPMLPPGAPKDAKEQMAAMSKDNPGTVTPVPGRVVPINSKYYTPESSGLTFKVGGGSNTFDVRLQN